MVKRFQNNMHKKGLLDIKKNPYLHITPLTLASILLANTSCVIINLLWLLHHALLHTIYMQIGRDKTSRI